MSAPVSADAGLRWLALTLVRTDGHGCRFELARIDAARATGISRCTPAGARQPGLSDTACHAKQTPKRISRVSGSFSCPGSSMKSFRNVVWRMGEKARLPGESACRQKGASVRRKARLLDKKRTCCLANGAGIRVCRAAFQRMRYSRLLAFGIQWACKLVSDNLRTAFLRFRPFLKRNPGCPCPPLRSIRVLAFVFVSASAPAFASVSAPASAPAFASVPPAPASAPAFLMASSPKTSGTGNFYFRFRYWGSVHPPPLFFDFTVVL